MRHPAPLTTPKVYSLFTPRKPGAWLSHMAGLAAWPTILSTFLMFAEGKDDLRRVIESLDQFAPEEIDRSRVVIIGKVTTGDRTSSVYWYEIPWNSDLIENQFVRLLIMFQSYNLSSCSKRKVQWTYVTTYILHGGQHFGANEGIFVARTFPKIPRFPALSLVFVVSRVGGNIPTKNPSKTPKTPAILNRCHLQISVLFENLCCRQDPEHCQHGGWWHCLWYLYRLGLQQCEG